VQGEETVSLFNNSADALRFAFQYSSQQYPQSPIASLSASVIGSGKGLVASDGAAQAGLILSAISTMDPMRANCIKARYAPKYEPCFCCGGKKPLKSWKKAIEELAEWSMSTFSGISHRSVREAIVLNYFDSGVSIADAAAGANVAARTAYSQRAKIHAALTLLDGAALRDVEDILESRKYIQK
jgi:hypothetical protein